MVGLILIGVKFEDIPYKGRPFIMSRSNFQKVGLIVEFYSPHLLEVWVIY